MKNKLLAGLLVSLALFVVGCSGPAADDKVGNIAPTNEEMASSDEESEQLVSAAQVYADSQQLASARSNNSLEDCDKIKVDSTKQDCKDIVTYNLVVGGDMEKCESIKNEDLKRQCEEKLEELLTAKKDVELQAQAFEKEDPKYCTEIAKDDDRTDCLLNLAAQTGKAEICQEIEDATLAADCAENL